jgi:hypothetical protein
MGYQKYVGKLTKEQAVLTFSSTSNNVLLKYTIGGRDTANELLAGESITIGGVPLPPVTLRFDPDSSNKYTLSASSTTYLDSYNIRIYANLFIPESVREMSAITQSVTYAELVSLRDNYMLSAGMQYRITNYVTTTAQKNTQSAGHQFDVIVTADNANTLNEVARACLHEGDTYFSAAGANLAAWKIWYSLDNDTDRFAWADRYGCGVIYRMIDEWNNDLPYDFKNIMFVRYKLEIPDEYVSESNDTLWIQQLYYNLMMLFWSEDRSFVWSGVTNKNKYWENKMNVLFSRNTGENFPFFTFTSLDNTDASLNGFTCNNTMQFSRTLPNNVFFDDACYNNNFGFDCNNNSIGGQFHNNSLGNGCAFNSFGFNCEKNIFGNECIGNVLNFDCTDNNFGNLCENISLDDSCIGNTFGFNNYGNSLGRNCHFNSFNNECYYNSLTYNCYYNSFVNGCNGVNLAEEHEQYNTASINSNGEVKVFNLADLADLLNS